MSDARETVHKAISASAVLRPLHVEVRNESCWYYMRKRLGPRRQAWFDIQYNEAHLHYEAFIYQLVRREEDLNVVPRKVLVGSAAERWKAFKICEKAIKERDNNALAIKRDALERGLKLDLDSHISLLVVSEAFAKLDNVDRLGVVCADLLASLGSPPASSSSDLSHCPPTKVKHFSTLGRQVLSLMIFRALPSHCGATLQIRALTPAQWRPQLYPPALSERLGRGHQQLGALGVSEGAQPDNQRWRLQKLSAAPFDVNSTTVGSHDDSRPVTSTVGDDSSVVSSRTDATDRSALRRPGRELVDSIGLHESVSGVQYAKLGGIYGHFFNDLSSDVRAMVLERYQNNKELIRIVAPAAEPAPLQAFPDQPQPSFQPKTNLSMLRAKIKANHELGEADRGSANQDEMRDEVMLSNKRIHLLALRLQRIRRIHMVYRARRCLWKRFYACLVVQRAVRGWFGRRFVGLFRKLQPIAARRIQSFYRNIRTNRVLYKWQSVSYRLTRVVMRLIKLFFQKCYLRWMAKREHSAALIQSAVRVRIAVVEKYKRMGDKHLVRFAFSKAAVKIQKTIRGLFGRRRYEAFLEEQLKQRVDAPAALKIQRIFRGRLAKCVLHQRRLERKCAIQIQRLVRYFLRMLGLARMRRAALEICSATAIQSAYRGHFDRLIVALRKHQRWYETKYIPSIVKLQAWMRTAFARKKYITLKTNNRAALVIQRSYLFNKKRWLGKLQRRRMFQVKLAVKVTMIQAAVRRFLCMKTFRRRLLAYRGKVIFAAKLISRAWKSFTLQRKYQELLDDSRREAEGRAIAKCFAVRQNILRDIREMQADLSQIDRGKERAAVRLKELKEFQAQSSLRLSSVKKEMEALTVDDFERGWAEALGQEYEYITQQALMSREELRLLNHKLFKAEAEALVLQLELEDNEIDLGAVEQKLRDTVHRAHRRELLAAERKAKWQMRKRVFRERVHWRIDSNRKLKMLRARDAYHKIIAASKAGRGVSHATSVSYEIHQQREDYEQMLRERMLMEEASERDQLSKPKTYQDYAKPVLQGFDRIVSSNLSLLRGLSLDDRAKTLKDHFQRQKVAQKKTRRGQFAALKPDYADQLRPKLT